MEIVIEEIMEQHLQKAYILTALKCHVLMTGNLKTILQIKESIIFKKCLNGCPYYGISLKIF